MVLDDCRPGHHASPLRSSAWHGHALLSRTQRRGLPGEGGRHECCASLGGAIAFANSPQSREFGTHFCWIADKHVASVATIDDMHPSLQLRMHQCLSLFLE